MTHVTHDQAFDALVNPDIPLGKAMKLFERAYRRSNDATKSSVIEAALGLRLKVRKGKGLIMTCSEMKERRVVAGFESQRYMRMILNQVIIAGEKRVENKEAFQIFDGTRTEWVLKALAKDNGDGTFTMPEWLARDKGFI